MKKSTSFVRIAFLFPFVLMALKGNAQYSLQTAKNCQFITSTSWISPVDSLPPLTEILPTGPFYGCSNISTRPLWYYFPDCISIQNAQFMVSMYSSFNNNPNVSIAAWGPFDDISNLTLLDLDSTKFFSCANLTVFSNTGSSQIQSKLDSGKVYVMVVTTDDTASSKTLGFSINIQPRFPTPGSQPYTNACHLCDGKATYMELFQNICNMTVDTPSNHISLIWEKDASDKGLYGYLIKRENTSGVYDSIGFVPYTSFSSYTDTSVNAMQQKRYYMVNPVDSCMQEYPPWPAGSNMVSPLYLQSYPGLNNVVNLTWNWIRFSIKNFIPVFYIWRSSNYGAFQVIDSMAAVNGLPYLAYYTDINVPAGPATYCIEVRQSTLCYPSFTATYGSSLSNPSGVMVLGVNTPVDLSSIKLLPNSTQGGYVTFDFGFHLTNPLDIALYSADGRLVDNIVIPGNANSYQYDTKNITPGIYYFRLGGKDFVKTMKLHVF